MPSNTRHRIHSQLHWTRNPWRRGAVAYSSRHPPIPSTALVQIGRVQKQTNGFLTHVQLWNGSAMVIMKMHSLGPVRIAWGPQVGASAKGYILSCAKCQHQQRWIQLGCPFKRPDGIWEPDSRTNSETKKAKGSQGSRRFRIQTKS